MSTGYSGTPLVQKLGIKPGMVVWAIEAPTEYPAWLAPLPAGASIAGTNLTNTQFAHLFVLTRDSMGSWLSRLREELGPEATIWVSWPKRASKVATDITEDTIRETALPLGFVDVKVCAISEVWSGLKLVVRKSLR